MLRLLTCDRTVLAHLAGHPARSRVSRWVGVAALLLAAACAEDDANPVGADELPQLSDSIQEVVLLPTRIETFMTAGEQASFDSLLVAAHALPDPAGFESHVLVRFALAIADTTQGAITVDSAKVRLLVADLAPDSVQVALHRVTESWAEGQVSWRDRAFEVAWSQPGGSFDPAPLFEGSLGADSAFVPIPDSLAQRWIDDPASNNGVLLRVETPASRIRFFEASTAALANENGPYLRLFLTVGDSSSVTDPIFATNDAYLANFAGGVPAAGIGIGDEPFLRSVLFFDISLIPANASINLAELRLVPDTVVAPISPLRLEARRVVSPFLGDQTVFSNAILVVDSVRTDSAATVSGSNLAALIRLWQADSSFNLGLGLQATDGPGNLGFAVFADSTAAPEDRPRLRVIFTPPLQSDIDRARP